MMDIVCANPFHARHEGEAGWCAKLGHREGTDSGTIQVGLFCSACAPYVSAVRDAVPLAKKFASGESGLIAELVKAVSLPADEIKFLLEA